MARSDGLWTVRRRARECGTLPFLARALMLSALLGGGAVAAARAGLDVETGIPAVTSASLLVVPAPRIVAGLPARPLAFKPPEPEAAPEGTAGRVDRVPYEDLMKLAMTPGDPDEILGFGPMRIRRHLVQTIVKAAREVEIDPELLMAIADKESSFSTAVQARTSSATGLFQFIERTWLGVVRDFGASRGLVREAALVATGDDGPVVADPAERARILDLRREPYLSAMLAGEMLKRDSARIAGRIGRTLSSGETYLAHFLGPSDAERFIAKVADAPKAAAAALLPKPAKANKPIFYAATGRKKARSLSVAQVHEKFETMMSARQARYRNVGSISGITAYAEAGTP